MAERDPALSSGHLQLKTSNRLEHLLEAWVHHLREQPLPPMEREIVVVQSQGMRRFLTLELARRRGIAAGLWMPFPRDLARCLTEAVLDSHLRYERGQEELGLFDREILLWRLFALLGQASAQPGHPLRIPAAYLQKDPDQRKRFQLAARLAALFDDYQLFRGDWLREFEAGRPLFPPEDPRQETAAWQAHLWRQLHCPGTGDSLARRLELTIEKLHRGWDAGTAPPLPPRITIFGVSSLPPVFLELLRATSRHLSVELYFASPTWHYWGDLFSDREQVRLARRFRRSAAAADGLLAPPPLGHLERGNSLLSGLGQQGRDFFNLLQELDESGESWHDVDFEEPGQDSVLHCLQSDILHLRDRSQVDPPLPLSAPENDPSLRVHVCHSPLREMEVLREELLRAFEEMPDLHPSRVLVLLPEIETYAPLIDAVFGVAHEGAPAMPYSVADRQLASTQKPAAALLALLELVHQRLTVAEVFGLLESPAIRRAAAIEENELTLLRQRVHDTRIRWAIDGRQRQEEFELPLFEESSWQAGIDRLLFGYTIGRSEKTTLGVAPYAGDAAGDTDLLGRFLAFLDRLFTDLRGLQPARPPAQWSRDLVALVDRHLQANDDDEELALQLLRDSFARLEEIPRLSEPATGPAARGEGPELPLEVIRQYLRRVLAEDQASGGFLSGGITFCALRPMRSIPFEVVAVAGLDDASFPRRDPPRVLDLLALAPRPGDRSPRLDDRYLFLETLLAARRRLLLFYPGANQRDAAERAPSVVLSELLDVADRTFVCPDGRPLRQHLVIRHPLQAWSPDNFGPHPRSSSRENAAACAALAGPRQDLPPFFSEPATAPEEAAEEATAESRELQLDQLLEALTSPGRYHCRHVLQLRLGRDEDEAPQTELFELATLPRFSLLQQMMKVRLGPSPPDRDDELASLRARFELPPALLGEATYRRLVLDAESLIGRLPAGLPGVATTLTCEIAGTGYLLRGQLELSSRHLLYLRPASLRPRDLLRAHLEMLMAQLAAPGDFKSAILLGNDGGFELRPWARPERAQELLDDLVALYREIRRRPLPFFEQASFVYAELQHRQLDPRKKRASAAELEAAARLAFEGRRPWENQGRHGPRGDRDPEIDLLWRGRDPLVHPEFGPLATRVFRPVLEARRELKT